MWTLMLVPSKASGGAGLQHECILHSVVVGKAWGPMPLPGRIFHRKLMHFIFSYFVFISSDPGLKRSGINFPFQILFRGKKITDFWKYTKRGALLTNNLLTYFGVSAGVKLPGRPCTGPTACLVSQVRAESQPKLTTCVFFCSLTTAALRRLAPGISILPTYISPSSDTGCRSYNSVPFW